MTRTATVVLSKRRYVVVFKENDHTIDTSAYGDWDDAANAIRLWLEKGE